MRFNSNDSPRCLCRPDVVIQAKDVLRIVLCLHFDESRVVLPSEARYNALLTLVPNEAVAANRYPRIATTSRYSAS